MNSKVQCWGIYTYDVFTLDTWRVNFPGWFRRRRFWILNAKLHLLSSKIFGTHLPFGSGSIEINCMPVSTLGIFRWFLKEIHLGGKLHCCSGSRNSNRWYRCHWRRTMYPLNSVHPGQEVNRQVVQPKYGGNGHIYPYGKCIYQEYCLQKFCLHFSLTNLDRPIKF